MLQCESHDVSPVAPVHDVIAEPTGLKTGHYEDPMKSRDGSQSAPAESLTTLPLAAPKALGLCHR